MGWIDHVGRRREVVGRPKLIVRAEAKSSNSEFLPTYDLPLTSYRSNTTISGSIVPFFTLNRPIVIGSLNRLGPALPGLK